MPLRIGNRVFAPGVPLTVVTVVLLPLLLGLGRWQVARMHEKQALFAAFEAGDDTTLDLSFAPGSARYQHVAAIGRYDSDHQFLLDNLTHQGRAGYHVLTPLVIDEARTVLVDRGWIALGAQRAVLPDVPVATDERSIAGRLNELPRAGIELRNERVASDAPWPRVVSYPKLAELEQALGRPLYPGIVQLDTGQPDGFVREWRPSTFPPERHLGYAVTWFTLAATLLAIYAVVGLRRGGDAKGVR